MVSMTHCPHLDLFLEALRAERGCAPNTLEAYARDIDKFRAFFKADVLAATESNVQSFLMQLHEQGYESRSVARHLSSLRQFFQFLY